MSSFFTTPASQKKRKRIDAPAASSKRRTISAAKPHQQDGRKPQVPREREESISGSESGDSDDEGRLHDDLEEEDASSSGEEGETADERRLRLAQRYLDNIKDEVADPNAFDAAEIDRDLIAERLKEDVAETKGKLYRKIAAELDFSTATHTYFTADQNGVTAIAACSPHAYTVSKDSSIAKWELATPTDPFCSPTNITPRKRPKLLKRFKCRSNPNKSYIGHTSAILCIAASSSGKFLATGGSDNRLVIWDAGSLKPLKVFTHHRDTILSVSFRRGTHTLFTASADRTIKIWSLDDMAYIETLFGHQDSVVGIAGLAQERCISVGARDRTARLWKVVEESQLVFRGGGSTATRTNKNDQNGATAKSYAEGSIDRIAMIDEDTFVTGSDNGAISLWSIHRKKPVHTILLAHGLDPPLTPEEAFAEKEPKFEIPGRPVPRWITALKTVPLSDLVLSGSWDGCLKAWRVSEDRRRLESVGIVGKIGTEMAVETNGEMVGISAVQSEDAENDRSEDQKIARGVINDIDLFERGERGKDGLCVVVAMAKEHRLAKWKKHKGKNGAVVFEVSRKTLENGVANGGEHE